MIKLNVFRCGVWYDGLYLDEEIITPNNMK